MVHAAHRRHVDLVELVAAEIDAGDVAYRHADLAFDRAVGRVAHQIAGHEFGVPQAAFAIDRGAIRDARRALARYERAFVRERAGIEVVVPRPVFLLERVGEIERLVVGAPARAVGADDAAIGERHFQVRVEPPQAADRKLFLVVHAAGEEPPASIALAVVQARARLVGVDLLDQLELLACEVEEIEAVIEREHRAAALAQRHRTDVAGEAPVLDATRFRIHAPDRGFAHAPSGAVDPVEATFLDVPHRAFAQIVGAFEHALDLVGHRGCLLVCSIARVDRNRRQR